MTEAEYDMHGNLIPWRCAQCGEMTSVRHFVLRRGGVIVHDPIAAGLDAAGLRAPEPTPPGTDGKAAP